ncbi:hypothetical protein FQR65_LT02276 [Abscondita terminalis]|nr:hypothetical protein FQR65_LT02276 [Abscondita terminalis]
MELSVGLLFGALLPCISFSIELSVLCCYKGCNYRTQVLIGLFIVYSCVTTKKSRQKNYTSTEAVHLPVDSEADLDALEFLLASQMDLAVKEISNLGGASIYDFIHRATLKLITNGFCGREYSYEGRRQKKSFRNLKVHELLTKSSMQLFTTTEKEVEMNIQKWIRRCTERAKAKLQN